MLYVYNFRRSSRVIVVHYPNNNEADAPVSIGMGKDALHALSALQPAPTRRDTTWPAQDAVDWFVNRGMTRVVEVPLYDHEATERLYDTLIELAGAIRRGGPEDRPAPAEAW